jgi:hypothetical protein
MSVHSHVIDAVRLGAVALVAAVLWLAIAASGTSFADGGSGGATTSHSTEVMLERGDRGRAVARVQRRLRIAADGVFGRQTERAVRRFQRRKGLVADGVVGPVTRRALGLAPFSRDSVSDRSPTSVVELPPILVRIAECESGGDPRAVSRDGRYRGKYQFTLATWRSLGGSGDPARAPESVQDRLALRLYRRSGTSPWPSCAGAARG